MSKLTISFYKSASETSIKELSGDFGYLNSQYVASITLPSSLEEISSNIALDSSEVLVGFKDTSTGLNYLLGSTYTYTQTLDQDVSVSLVFWIDTQYTIKYVTSSGDTVLSTTNTKTYDSTLGTVYLSDPELTNGYRFAGWIDNKNSNPLTYINSENIPSLADSDNIVTIIARVYSSNRLAIYGRSLVEETSSTNTNGKYVLMSNSRSANTDRQLTALNIGSMVTDIIRKRLVVTAEQTPTNIDISHATSLEVDLLVNVSTTQASPLAITLSSTDGFANKSVYLNVGSADSMSIIYLQIASKLVTVYPGGRLLITYDSIGSTTPIVKQSYSPISETGVKNTVTETAKKLIPGVAYADVSITSGSQDITLTSIQLAATTRIRKIDAEFDESVTDDNKGVLRCIAECLNPVIEFKEINTSSSPVVTVTIDLDAAMRGNNIFDLISEAGSVTTIPMRFTYVI